MDYIFVCAVAFVVAALTLFSGFGLGTLLMPAFAFFFPLEMAIAATAVVHLANNALKVFLVGRAADVKITLRFALPAAVAAVFGAALLGSLGETSPLMTYTAFGRELRIEPIRLVIGSLIAVFAVLELSPRLQKVSLPSRLIPLGGALSGFFGGLSGHQGALRSMFLIKAGLSKEAYIGTTVVAAVVVDVTRLVVYGTTTLGEQMRALRDGDHVMLVVVGTAAAMLGTILGSRLIAKVTLETVQRIVSVLLLVIASGMILGII